MSTNWLEDIVNCPKCGKPVMEGDRIWLDGECLCPQCYMNKRNKLDKEKGTASMINK